MLNNEEVMLNNEEAMLNNEEVLLNESVNKILSLLLKLV
jgi:hypothetical protein